MPEISESLQKRLKAKGPKKILSLDGGGIRGALTVGFLEEIERILAERHDKLGIMNKDKFRLHHYFDLIGGTSTGAIIAALLAVGGYSAAEIKEMYISLGGRIFSDRNGFNLFGKRIYTNRKYDSKPLKDELQKIFGDARLGDNTNKTGLCVVAKRLDTCSTWPVTNNPEAKYFKQNRFFIRDIVRASTAAPSFFEPEIIDVGLGQEGVFVDGGMSMMNNPSLQLFLVATLKGFNLRWETGEKDMLIVSIGTGRRSKKLIGQKWNDPNLLDIAKLAPEQFMSDANELVEMMMHFIGTGTGPLRKIDSEIDNLSDDAIHGGKAFSYLRYNVEVVKNELDSIGITDLSDVKISSLMNMDLPENVDLLIQIGVAAARQYVSSNHLPDVFDLKEIPV
ncbi:MAG: patatin-like phospholipase family protein [Chitinophagaceae bacterium]